MSLQFTDIEAAYDRIRSHIVRTPVVRSERLAASTGLDIWFKCENLQHVGAFKTRGACNAVFSLTEEEADRGVVTHSSGNHAAALARAASLRGIQAHVVMPENSLPNKIAAVQRYGVQPVYSGPEAESRQAVADEIIRQTGATFIHPYNNLQVMAGQGTVGIELAEQVPDVDVVVMPVGGGGLLAGNLVALKHLRPDVKVFAGEPAWADDAHRSLQSGKIESPNRYDTIGDGLRTPLGSMTFPPIANLVDAIILATEEQIVAATHHILEEAKLVVEPSAAVPLAALLAHAASHADQFKSQRIAIVLSGGNLNWDSWPPSPFRDE